VVASVGSARVEGINGIITLPDIFQESRNLPTSIFLIFSGDMIRVGRELSNLEVSERPFLVHSKYSVQERFEVAQYCTRGVAFPGSKSSAVPLSLSVLVLEK
jgi:hypothetical protein